LFLLEFFSESQKITCAQLFSFEMHFLKKRHANTDFQRIEPLPKIEHERLNDPTV